eukprot:gene7010-26127_t
MSSPQNVLRRERDAATFNPDDMAVILQGTTDLKLNAMSEQAASDEQRKKWLPAAESCAIIGCYAQTEMGHGSDVAGLETTATFVLETGEFELNSPTLTSTKWWPAALGRTATHAVVHCRVRVPARKGISNGVYKDFGPKPFLVQLRDLSTHVNLPGIETGDIGPTMGLVAIEEGYARFNKVRVPVEAMLARYQQVTREGEYVANQRHSRRGYGTMMLVRAMMVRASCTLLSKAATIAVRYCVLRRQFKNADGTGEIQVLDYQGVQYRVLPWATATFALHFCAKGMVAMHAQMASRVDADDDSLTAETHAIGSCLKVVCTTACVDGIEELRRACGGHGFSNFSGLPLIYGNAMVNYTGEGEAYMLIQQTTKWLADSYVLDGGLQIAAFEQRAARLLDETAAAIAAAKRDGASPAAALQACQWQGVQASIAFGEMLIVRSIVRGVDSAPTSCQPALARAKDLYVLTLLQRRVGDFTADGFVSSEQIRVINRVVKSLMPLVRVEIVPLMESFGHHDLELNTAIGPHDGKVYERLLQWAREDPMNKGSVVQGWDETWKPIVEEARDRLLAESG